MKIPDASKSNQIQAEIARKYLKFSKFYDIITLYSYNFNEKGQSGMSKVAFNTSNIQTDGRDTVLFSCAYKTEINKPFAKRVTSAFCGWLFAFFKRTMMTGGGMQSPLLNQFSKNTK